MTYSKIPLQEAVLLVRTLGLLVNQAGIYGATHRVTQSAAQSVFDELDRMVSAYGVIEIAVKDNRLLLNGSVDGLDEAVCKNLLDRMVLHKVGGIEFLSPTERGEFMACLSLFGTSPYVMEEAGGFEAALKRANLRSVRIVSVAYRRVGRDTPETEDEPMFSGAPDTQERPRPAAGSGTGVIDLSAAWADWFGLPPPDQSSLVAAAMKARKERTAALAALLRDTAAALERADTPSDEEQYRTVRDALSQIRETILDATRESERQISTLAGEVDEDREAVESIEAEARRGGVELKLTRGELIERYAELNQEIVQPLTVSTGVIDLLHSGKGGPLTESQRELLKLAYDSVERVNQLVAIMRRVAGLPSSFTPDAEIIQHSYQ